MKNSKDLALIDNLYSKDVLDSLYEVASKVFMPPSTYFLDIQSYVNGSGVELLSEHFPIEFVHFIFLHLDNITSSLPNEEITKIGGFEIWIGNTGVNSKSINYLHVDNDEFLRTSEGRLVSPSWGSILYITPSVYMEGGETLFCLEDPDIPIFEHTNLNNLKKNCHVQKVSSKQGRLVVFNGVLPHGVLPYTLKKDFSRVNLMVNIWKDRISSVPNGISFLNHD